MTFALDAETTGGWCLPEAQLAIAGIQVARAIYDYLTVPDDKGDYVPILADKVTPNADYTTWTIHLRSGIKFHDGTRSTRRSSRTTSTRTAASTPAARRCCSCSSSTTSPTSRSSTP